MMKKAKNTVVVTSWGLCESAGIQSQSKEPCVRKQVPEIDERDAKPAFSHFALVGLMEQELIKTWVTTTYDNLPFQAGVKIGAINQLHGSLNDMDNQQKKDNPDIHPTQMRWLLNLTATADLVIAVGCRMRDVNAVRPAQAVALKAMDHDSQLLEGSEEWQPQVQGLCIINEQQTALDNICQMRLWGPSDHILKKLCSVLKVPVKTDHKMSKYRWKSHAPKVFATKEIIDSYA